MNILVDTREQTPLLFSTFQDVRISKDKLDAGDYTIAGYDRPNDDYSIIFERKKNALELITNVVAQWDRFCRELDILSMYKYKQIIVCGQDNIEYLYKNNLTRVHPNFFYSKLSKMYLEYGVSTVFLNGREAVEQYVYRTFNRIILNDTK